MSTRYIFNTAGQYVAFVQSDNLFATNAEWLGFIRNGNIVYDTSGKYMGLLLEDDRIVKKTYDIYRPTLLRPLRPMRPMRPLSPLKRLRMTSLPLGYEDVFLHTPTIDQILEDLSSLNKLIGSKLIANDGVFLGLISNNAFDQNSILNKFGNYGNKYSNTSIFNKYSIYGSEYSALSPFNKFSSTPPYFLKNGVNLGKLTVNQFQFPRIEPEKFIAWLEKL